jgi:hypothetical protein
MSPSNRDCPTKLLMDRTVTPSKVINWLARPSMLRISRGWPSLKGLPCTSHISLHTQVIRARRLRRQTLETAGWRSRDASEPSEDLKRVPAQSTQGRCSDSAQVLRVQYYAPYTGAFARVGDGSLDEEERK